MKFLYLRTETTINHNSGIGKQLKNLPALRQIGFQANLRLLDIQTISHVCSIGEEAFEKVVRPIEVEGQRASAFTYIERYRNLYHRYIDVIEQAITIPKEQ